MNSSTLGRRHTYFQLTILDLWIGNLYAIWFCHLMQRGSHCYPSVRRPMSVANISFESVSQVRHGKQTGCLIMMTGNTLKAGKQFWEGEKSEQKGSAKGAFHCVWVTMHFLCTPLNGFFANIMQMNGCQLLRDNGEIWTCANGWFCKLVRSQEAFFLLTRRLNGWEYTGFVSTP